MSVIKNIYGTPDAISHQYNTIFTGMTNYIYNNLKEVKDFLCDVLYWDLAPKKEDVYMPISTENSKTHMECVITTDGVYYLNAHIKIPKNRRLSAEELEDCNVHEDDGWCVQYYDEDDNTDTIYVSVYTEAAFICSHHHDIMMIAETIQSKSQ